MLGHVGTDTLGVRVFSGTVEQTLCNRVVPTVPHLGNNHVGGLGGCILRHATQAPKELARTTPPGVCPRQQPMPTGRPRVHPGGNVR